IAKAGGIMPTVQHVDTVSPSLSPLETEQLSLLGTLTGHKYAVYSVALSANGQTLASGSEDKTIKVWNLSTGKEVRTLTGHEYAVYSVALSADGQSLDSGSIDKMIKVCIMSKCK